MSEDAKPPITHASVPIALLNKTISVLGKMHFTAELTNCSPQPFVDACEVIAALKFHGDASVAAQQAQSLAPITGLTNTLSP